MTESLADFPKIQCPFIRQTFPINKDHFKQRGNKHGLRGPEVYLAVNRVTPGYEWVFDDPDNPLACNSWILNSGFWIRYDCNILQSHPN